jgi:hypothetical protein
MSHGVAAVRGNFVCGGPGRIGVPAIDHHTRAVTRQ